MAYWYRVFPALESADFQNLHCSRYVLATVLVILKPVAKTVEAVMTTFGHHLYRRSALGAYSPGPSSGEISQTNLLFSYSDSNPGIVVKIRSLVACERKAGCRYRHKPGGRALLARSGEQDAKQHTEPEPPSYVEICRNGDNCTQLDSRRHFLTL
jgi:hypothetical protein